MQGEAWRNFELKPAFNPYSPQERCFFFKNAEHVPQKGGNLYQTRQVRETNISLPLHRDHGRSADVRVSNC